MIGRNYSWDNDLQSSEFDWCDARKSASWTNLQQVDTFDYGPLVRFNLNVMSLLIQCTESNPSLQNVQFVNSLNNLLKIIETGPIYINDPILRTRPNVFVNRFFQTIHLKVDAISLKYYGILSPMFIYHENFPITKVELEYMENNIITVIKNVNRNYKFETTFFEDFWYKVCPTKYGHYKEHMSKRILVCKEQNSIDYRKVGIYIVIIVIIFCIFNLMF